MVNVVDDANVLPQLEEILDRRNKVLAHPSVRLSSGVSKPILMLKLQAAYAAEIVLARVKEHAAEQVVAVSSVGGSPGRSLR